MIYSLVAEYRGVHKSILKRQIKVGHVDIPMAAQTICVKTSGTLR